ncbi:hypothetical protein PVK06_027541 [Gossypium arboreum]|uniref:Retrotransposon gag domain-containing protein n=1 Tax=Gossypium arboreum TaxID=29729 RepID=A0ABR0P0K0_GOSAR|nr:hypothetical protein PVK06_027541 [Gossypium arboreum]
MIFIRHHLHEGLKVEYLTVKDPLELWKNLKERFDHQKTVILPKARYDWMHLRLQDFKTVSEYNSELFKISSQLKLCGENITDEDLLDKTFSTFHATNVLLQQQYREKGFKRYSELISCLLVAEQNNELLMKNHGIRPTSSAPFPEVNVAVHNNYENRKYKSRGRGRGRSEGRGRGRISNHYYSGYNNDTSNHHKKNDNERQERSGQNNPSKIVENICYRYGMKGHWSRTCRTSEHLVKLYQASIKRKGKHMETNFISQNDEMEAKDEDIHYNNKTDHAYGGDKFNDLNNIIHLDVADFFENH